MNGNRPHIDIHMRITLSDLAVREFASPMEAAEHAAQIICSHSRFVNAVIIPAPDLGDAVKEFKAGLDLVTRAFQQVTSSESSVNGAPESMR